MELTSEDVMGTKKFQSKVEHTHREGMRKLVLYSLNTTSAFSCYKQYNGRHLIGHWGMSSPEQFPRHKVLTKVGSKN